MWGTTFANIKSLLDKTEELYLGLFIHSLRYDNEKKGAEEKKKYLDSIKVQINKINKEVKVFNAFREISFGRNSKLTKLTPINFSHIKTVINKHKGDYPTENGLAGVVKESIGVSSSASSLSRKHTALLLRNILFPLRQDLSRFVESLETFENPYLDFIKSKNKLRQFISKEIEKSKVCYSVNLRSEAVFIIGRLLENQCHEWLLQLKKEGNLKLKEKSIKTIEKFDLDTKLNYLHNVLKKISPSQYSKAMALKWDRNSFGHKIGRQILLSKDIESNIKTGINLIIFFESKINRK